MTTTAVVLADAARARIFTVEKVPGQAGVPTPALIEQICLVNPARRQRPSEKQADTRPGSRRAAGGSGVGHAVDDRRDAHADELDRRFAEEVVDALAKFQDSRFVVAAPPKLLGMLRDRAGTDAATYLPLDLSRLTPARALEQLQAKVQL